MRASDEAALLGWVSATWARSDVARISRSSVRAGFLNSVSYATFRVRAALTEIRDEIRVLAQSLSKQTQPVLKPAGATSSDDGRTATWTHRYERSDYIGPSIVGVFSVELGEAIKLVQNQKYVTEVLTSTTSEENLKNTLCSLQPDSYDSVQTFQKLHTRNEEKTRDELNLRDLHWSEKAIFGMVLIQTVMQIITFAEKPTDMTHIEVLVEQQTPASTIIVLPQGLPTMNIPALVEVEVFDTLGGNKRGVVVRTHPSEDSERLDALNEGMRAHIIEYGRHGSRYSKIRYQTAGGAFLSGWVLTDKLRRVE